MRISRNTPKTRLRYRDKKPPSRLEAKFARFWSLLGGPPLETEVKFHQTRRWRADFAHLPSRTLIEIEGGIYVNGRHNRASGFNADMEKYLEAALAGWLVIRLGDDQITASYVERLKRLVSEREAEKRVADGGNLFTPPRPTLDSPTPTQIR